MKRKIVNARRMLILGLLVLPAVGSMMGGYAYLSGITAAKKNKISLTAGENEQKGDISVIEPEWNARKEADANYAMNLQPGQTVIKDPRIESSTDYPCWVFAEISIPTTAAMLNKEDNPYQEVIFSGNGNVYFDAFELIVPEINYKDWELYSRQAEEKFVVSYLYGYKTPLEPGNTTSPVFETITIPEFKQAEGKDGYIKVRAKAIQAEGCPTLDEAAKKLGIEHSVEITTVNSTP